MAALAAVPVPVLIVAAETDRLGELDLLVGYALMAATYAAIVWALRPVVAPAGDGRRLHALTRVFAAVVAVVGLVLMSLLAVAVATGS